MKKLIVLLIAILLVPSLLWADTLGMDTSLIARKKDAVVASSCPSYHNAASVVLSMDYDHDDDVLTACDSSGNPVVFTDFGSDISTYNIGGDTTNKMKLDAESEDIYFIQDPLGEYLDGQVAQTVCMSIYVVSQPDEDVRIFRGTDASANDAVSFNVDSDNSRVAGFYEVETGSDRNVPAATLNWAGWKTVAYSWDEPNDDHSANPGDNGTWGSGWDEDANELTDAQSDKFTYIQVGSISYGAGGDPGTTGIVYIRGWLIATGYQFDCSTVTW